MNKKEIKNSIKIAIISVLFISTIAYAYDWFEATCTPPGCDVSSPIDIGHGTQTKTGKLYIEDDNTTIADEGNLTADRVYGWGTVTFYDKLVLGVTGVLGVTPNLFVKDGVQLQNLGVTSTEPGVDNSSLVYAGDGVNVCADETGRLVACAVDATEITTDPYFSASTEITIVSSSIDSALATEHSVKCPLEYPYVIGGGGYCQDGDLFEGKGIKKLEPTIVGTNPGYYNGWKTSCNVSDKTIQVFAICSK